MRFILLLFVIGALWLLLRQLAAPRPPRVAPPRDDAEPMKRCARCGLHVPRSRALRKGAHWYCCEDHAEHPDD